jgi:hypothetical protein
MQQPAASSQKRKKMKANQNQIFESAFFFPSLSRCCVSLLLPFVVSLGLSVRVCRQTGLFLLSLSVYVVSFCFFPQAFHCGVSRSLVRLSVTPPPTHPYCFRPSAKRGERGEEEGQGRRAAPRGPPAFWVVSSPLPSPPLNSPFFLPPPLPPLPLHCRIIVINLTLILPSSMHARPLPPQLAWMVG